ncbi:MAG: hypothetical protein RL264_1870 [Bacteroidota bacterium]|jgi:hypothetical protein
MRTILLLFLLHSFSIWTQIQVHFTVENQLIFPETKIILNDGNWIEFETVKLYLQFPKSKSVSADSVFLIDLADSNSLILPLPYSIDHVDLLIGLDSLLNTSARVDGNLDPALGMYWAWNSGYIHLKVTGKSSLVTNEKHQFDWHLGGYRKPYPTQFSLTKKVKNGKIDFNLDSFIQELRQSAPTIKLMSPGKKAHQLMSDFIQSNRQ